MIRGRRVDIPMVSVLLTVNGDAQNLKSSIESLQAQSYPNFEIIILSTSSLLETRKLLRKYKKKFTNIRLIQLQKQTPFQKAIEEGLDQARGEYLVYTEQSHIHSPHRLSMQFNHFQKHKNCIATFSTSKLIETNRVKEIEYFPFSLMIARARVPFRFNPYDPKCILTLPTFGKVGLVKKTLLTIEKKGQKTPKNHKTVLAAALTSHLKGTLKHSKLTTHKLTRLFNGFLQGLRLAWSK